jgi:hypothetical protein
VRVVKNHQIDLLSSLPHSGYAGNAVRVLAAYNQVLKRRQAMAARHHLAMPGVRYCLLFAAAFVTPASVRSEEPLETVRGAFSASSKGLTSGSGNGTYRYYESLEGGDWVLKSDADISTRFDGKKYSRLLPREPGSS